MSRIYRTIGTVAMVPKGEYDAEEYYEYLNVVTYNDSTYMALKASTGVLPTDTEYWQFIGGGVKKENTIIVYNSVADMKSDTKLKAGMTVKTNGYYEINDNKNAEYYITDDILVNEEQITLDNGLYATKIKTSERLYNAPFGINGWWTNSNGTKRSDRYNYRDNGISAIYSDIDDYVEIGLTEMCLTIQMNRTGDTFEISGGDAFLDDLLLATTYAENKGINVDTVRIMGTTTNTPVMNSDAKNSYLSIIDTILEKFSDSKFKYINVLNELHTTILDDSEFALSCINKITRANKKSIVSIELYSNYSNNKDIIDFLESNVDVIGLNAYPRCAAYKDKLNAKLLDEGVENLFTYFDKIQSLNKPIFIMETGVADVYAALIRCSLSTNDIPQDIQVNSYGLAEKELMLSFFKYFGNNVDRIYNWWTSGLTYPLECKPNAKKLCQALLQKGRD